MGLSQFLDATEKLCNLPATDERLKKLEENAPSACYQCLLMYHLLTDGFHFDEKSWDQLHVAKRLNGMELGWGLGRAILHSVGNTLGPWRRPASPQFVGSIQGKTSQELHASQGDDVEWPPFLPRDKRSIYLLS